MGGWDDGTDVCLFVPSEGRIRCPKLLIEKDEGPSLWAVRDLPGKREVERATMRVEDDERARERVYLSTPPRSMLS